MACRRRRPDRHPARLQVGIVTSLVLLWNASLALSGGALLALLLLLFARYVSKMRTGPSRDARQAMTGACRRPVAAGRCGMDRVCCHPDRPGSDGAIRTRPRPSQFSRPHSTRNCRSSRASVRCWPCSIPISRSWSSTTARVTGPWPV